MASPVHVVCPRTRAESLRRLVSRKLLATPRTHRTMKAWTRADGLTFELWDTGVVWRDKYG